MFTSVIKHARLTRLVTLTCLNRSYKVNYECAISSISVFLYLLFISSLSCPPRSFLPALCHIFMDETAPDNILEVTARAITYYLDVSAECSRRIVNESGAVKALCTRLVVVDISSRASRDLAEQCVKVTTIYRKVFFIYPT